MKVVGLDIAKSTGVAFVRPGTDPKGWRCLALQSEEDDVWSTVDELGEDIRSLIIDERPDFAVLERPLGVIVDHGASKARTAFDDTSGSRKRMINATTTITLSALAGNVIGVLNALEIPFGVIAIATWRAGYFGPGVKPADGDWKALSVRQAERIGVALPKQKKAAQDAADAVGIACSWPRCTFIPRRHHAAFLNLRTNGRKSA